MSEDRITSIVKAISNVVIARTLQDQEDKKYRSNKMAVDGDKFEEWKRKTIVHTAKIIRLEEELTKAWKP